MAELRELITSPADDLATSVAETKALLMKPGSRRPAGLTDAERMAIMETHMLEGWTCKTACKVSFGSLSTLHAALKKSPELRRRYDEARQLQADAMANAVVDLADSNADPAKVRNQIDSRKWLAGCVKPRVYGPKAEISLAVQGINVMDTLHDARSRLVTMPFQDAEIVEPPGELGTADVPGLLSDSLET